LFDRAGLPPAARQDFAGHADLLIAVHGDVTDRQGIADVVAGGYHAIVLGAAITAGPARDRMPNQSCRSMCWLKMLEIETQKILEIGSRALRLQVSDLYGARRPFRAERRRKVGTSSARCPSRERSGQSRVCLPDLFFNRDRDGSGSGFGQSACEMRR
jgi:hypothetical protein